MRKNKCCLVLLSKIKVDLLVFDAHVLIFYYMHVIDCNFITILISTVEVLQSMIQYKNTRLLIFLQLERSKYQFAFLVLHSALILTARIHYSASLIAIH